MSPQAARMFALGTGFIAVVAVCVATLMGMRLHKTRAAVSALQGAEGCLQPAAPARSP
ncbi:MAG: hypothetical protein JNL82_09030 [Myxococcales bacterium]|nr:hypothetical protein [Myxococcales bacterium]